MNSFCFLNKAGRVPWVAPSVIRVIQWYEPLMYISECRTKHSSFVSSFAPDVAVDHLLGRFFNARTPSVHRLRDSSIPKENRQSARTPYHLSITCQIRCNLLESGIWQVIFNGHGRFRMLSLLVDPSVCFQDDQKTLAFWIVRKG